MVFVSNELDMLILQHGEDGKPSDSRYTWVKYSQYPDGKDLTDDPTDAIYMGIANNKLESLESNNPSDYTWIKIKGDKGSDGYTVILTNENISFAVSNKEKISIANQTFFTEIIVMQGKDERKDFVIGEIPTVKGIEISKNENTVTMSVKAGTYFEAENGYIRIPISIDGKVFFKDVLWNLSKQGEDGEQGEPALSVSIGNEMQNIPCTNDGVVIENVLINIPFTGHRGFDMTTCTASVGLLPNGITLGTNTPSSNTDSGIIILNVAKDSELGGKSVLTGDIDITFTIENKKFKRIFSWSKTKDGGLSTVYSIEPSTYVLAKNYDETLSPSSVTFQSFYQENGTTRLPYLGRFVVEETENNVTYTSKYLSSNNEDKITYVPSSSSISAIRCSMYESGSITKLLDRQSITILKDIDNIKPTITEIKTSISGVDSKVDAVNKSITDKVWQSDITTQINNYDNTTVKTIRDQVAEQKVELGKITNKVSDVESTFTEGLHTLTERVSANEQTVEGFKQTVESNYTKKDELNTAIESTKSEFNQKADEIVSNVKKEFTTKTEFGEKTTYLETKLKQTAEEIKGEVSDLEGSISTVTQKIDSVTTEVKNARGDKTSLAVRIDGIQTEVSNSKGDISNLRQTATELSTKIQSAQGEISKINQKADEISQRVENVNKNLSSEIKQTAQNIELSVKNVSDNLKNNYYNKTETDAKFEITNKSITSTVKEEVSKIDVGARNLLLDSNIEVSNDSYNIAQYIMAEKMSSAKTYTCTIWGALGEGKECFGLWLDGGNISLGRLKDNKNGTYSVTFTGKNGTLENSVLYVYTIPSSLTVNSKITKIKLENGNKATDWTPAPEDLDPKEALGKAEDALNKLDIQEGMLTTTMSQIEQLSDSISMMVTDKSGNSLMTQTGNGWTFNMGGIQDTINEAISDISKNESSINDANKYIDTLEKQAKEIENKTAVINFTTVNGQPAILLGQTSNSFKLRITNTSIDFIDGSTVVAYISNKVLYIEKAVIKNEIQIGEGSGFVFKRRTNGNMGIRWVKI